VLPAITPMPVFTNCNRLLIYLPQKDERLSQLGWLTYSGRFTRINGYLSAVNRVQDRESSPLKDQRSTTVPRNQHVSKKLLMSSKKMSQLTFDWARYSP